MTSYLWYWLFPSYYKEISSDKINLDNSTKDLINSSSDTLSNSLSNALSNSSSNSLSNALSDSLSNSSSNLLSNEMKTFIQLEVENKVRPAAGRNNPCPDYKQTPKCLVAITNDELSVITKKLNHVEISQEPKNFDSELTKQVRSYVEGRLFTKNHIIKSKFAAGRYYPFQKISKMPKFMIVLTSDQLKMGIMRLKKTSC